jgi:hypothetical protein
MMILDVEHLVESQHVEDSTDRTRRRHDDEVAAKRLDSVVCVHQGLCPTRIHESESTDVEAESTTLPVQTPGYSVLKRGCARDIELASDIEDGAPVAERESALQKRAIHRLHLLRSCRGSAGTL